MIQVLLILAMALSMTAGHVFVADKEQIAAQCRATEVAEWLLQHIVHGSWARPHFLHSPMKIFAVVDANEMSGLALRR